MSVFIDGALTRQIVQALGDGQKLKDVAERIGVTRATLSGWLTRYEGEHGKVPRRGRGNLEQGEQDDPTGDRCKCGLRLPCNNCLELEDFVKVGAPGQTQPDVPKGSGIEIREAFKKFMEKRGMRG